MASGIPGISKTGVFTTAAAILFAAAVLVHGLADVVLIGRPAFTIPSFAAIAAATLLQAAVVTVIARRSRSDDRPTERG